MHDLIRLECLKPKDASSSGDASFFGLFALSSTGCDHPSSLSLSSSAERKASLPCRRWFFFTRRVNPWTLLVTPKETPLNSKVLLLDSFLILLSFALGRFVSPAWLWLSAFVGLNIIQSAFTGFYPAEKLLGGRKKPTSADQDNEG